MSTPADYVGRTVDLCAFQLLAQPFQGEQLLVQSLVSSRANGSLVAGVQKVAQRFLAVLLTKKNSVPFDSEFGTTFMLAAEQGGWRTSADASQAFYAARLDALRQITDAELPDDPADERIDDAILAGIVLAGDKLSIRITIVTQAGSAFTYLTPLGVMLK